MLEIDNLSIKYREEDLWAIKDLSFKTKSGQLLLIVGASGSGKSTLAKGIIGIIPYFEKGEIQGKILLDEKNVLEISRESLIKKIGYVPQYPADFTIQMVVEDEIAFPLENTGINRTEIEERVNLVLNQLNINHLRSKLMTQLSSGELQRVALATAFISLPPILILDEPFSRIDPKSEMIFSSLLKQMTDKGHCVIVFDHRLDYILPQADRVIYLHNGEMKSEGSPKEVIEYLGDVDIPEVSEINNPISENKFLSIDEAKESLTSFFQRV